MVLLDGLYDSSCNLSLLRGTPNIMKEIWQQLLHKWTDFSENHMVDNLDLNHHYQSSNVKKNIFLITISVHMFQQCSNDFSSNLKWYEIFRRLSRTIFLMHAEKYYSDDTGTLKLKYSSSKKVCRVATPCTSYSLNTHTPPPNSCPPNGTNRTFSYIFYIKYLYFKFLNCSGLKSGYNWKYALEMRNRYTLCEYIGL